MLYWTCPECGRECSPAVRDCPVCPPVSERELETPDVQATGILALAQNLETIHALPLHTTAPEQVAQTVENGRPMHASAGTLVEEPPAQHAREVSAHFVVEDAATPAQEAMLVLAEETLAIPVKQTVDSLVRPLVESVELNAAVAEPPADPEIAVESAAVIGEPETSETALVAEPVPQPVRDAAATETSTAPEYPAEQPAKNNEHSNATGGAAAVVSEPEASETAPAAEPTTEPVCETAAAAPDPVAAFTFAGESEQPANEEGSRNAVGAAEPTVGGLDAQETALIAETVPEPARELASPAETDAATLCPATEEAAFNAVDAAEPIAGEIESSKAAQSDVPIAEPEPVRETATATEADVAPTSPAESNEEPRNAIGAAEPVVSALTGSETALIAEPVPEPAGETASPAGTDAAPSCPATEGASSNAVDAAEPSAGEIEASEAASLDVPGAEPEPVREIPLVQTAATILPAPVPEPPQDSSQVDLPSEPPARAESIAASEIATVFELAAPAPEPTLPSEPAAVELSEGTPTLPAAAGSLPDPLSPASREICCALELQAEALVESIGIQLETDRVAVGVVVASFRKQSSTVLLAAPTEIVSAPAPPIFEWRRTSRPLLEALAPPPANLTAVSAPPQPPTLAGPCLPRELRNPAESEIPKLSRKSSRLPGWVTSSIAATLLLLVAWTLLQYFGSQNDAKASTPTGSPAASSGGAAQSEALAKSLEISGLRLVTGWNGKQQIRFLIVNHSPQELSGVTAQVTVKAEGSPILLIQVPIRSLGSNQSKEIRTDLDSDVPASALSDWQSLRAEVHLINKE
jgi:hypothetical protein